MPDKENCSWLPAILILAVLTRVIIVLAYFHSYVPESDAWQWHTMAQNILNGRGAIVNEDLLAFRTPIPGLYFAAIYYVWGESVRAVQVANIFIGVFTVWLVYDLTRRIFDITSARCAALLVAFYPTVLLYTGQLLSETPVIFLITLALWLAWLTRSRPAIWLAPVGLVLGLAVLTRQTVLPIAVLIAIWTLVNYRAVDRWTRMSRPLVILAFLAVTLVPWTVRNYFLFDKFIPLTTLGGYDLWLANNPLADGTTLELKTPSMPQVDSLPEAERGAVYQSLALQFIQENPLPFAELVVRRMQYFWHLGYHGQGWAEVVFLFLYLPILGLSIIGIPFAWRINREGVLLLLTVPVSLTLVHAVFLPEGRYRLPAELVVCILAGFAVAKTFLTGTARQRTQIQPVATALEKRHPR